MWLTLVMKLRISLTNIVLMLMWRLSDIIFPMWYEWCLHERDTYISYHQEKKPSLSDGSSTKMYHSVI